ncbi:MAG: hypothetical protein D6731_06010, partial [Planctomycetota bacterium]
MIVRALRARGFMRYEALDLEDLPRGVIALVGENESGKSTVGEAIAFALFGRTIRTEETDPTHAIHWDADEAHTSIDVELAGQGVFRVERRVARTGEFDARLFGPRGQEVAQGPRPVSEALQRILGYDFSAFRYSFYVAQGELDLIQREGRDNASRVVRDMVGISTLERARQRLEGERAELRERAEVLDRDLIVANALHTEALPLREDLAGYEQRLQAAREAQASAQNEEARAAEAYQRWERARAAERRRAAALDGLERVAAAAALRSSLLAVRDRLAALQAAAEAASAEAEKALAIEARPREQARAAVERAEAILAAAQRLEALVQHRAEELRRATAGEDPDSLPARAERERERAQSERRRAAWATWLGVASLALAAVGAGYALGLHLPREAPWLSPPPETLRLFGGRLQLTGLGARGAAALAGGAGALFALLGAVLLVRRRRAAARRRSSAEEAARLAERLDADRRELAACEAFRLGSLAAVGEALSEVRDAAVRAALDELRRVAGAQAESSSSPSELLASARGRLEELEG